MQCEICKVPYPYQVSFKNTKVEVLDYDVPSDDYILVESYPKEGSKNPTSKSIYVINMSGKNEIKMGRGHDCDIRIADISVSRLHGVVRVLNDNSLILEDRSSKFGTLALCKTPLFIPTSKSFS